MKDPKTLDEAYEIYKAGRMLRKDLFRRLIDAIKDLQDRIGAVDEAAVNELRGRVGAMETTIGNALRRPIERAAFVDDGSGGVVPQILPESEKRKPGRPKKEAA